MKRGALRWRSALTVAALLGALFAVAPLAAQVLARPGWAGSGVAPEAWWVRAVIYRIDPARFQDSNSDGQGDLRGLAQRLDYLQSLGVDALLLDGSAFLDDADAFGDLVRESSRHQLRVLVTAPSEPSTSFSGADLKSLREALGAGAAGIWLPRQQQADATYAAQAQAIRSLLQTFPGDRILLLNPTALELSPARRPGRGASRINPDQGRAARGGVLTTRTLTPLTETRLAQDRFDLASSGEEAASGLHPVLQFAPGAEPRGKNALADAALLFGSRGAVLLNFGEEIGLALYSLPRAGQPGVSGPVMQWTPSNHTPAAASTEATEAPVSTTEQFGTYHPYTPPPRGLGINSPAAHVLPDLNIPEALPAPDTLPGFTAGTLPMAPQDGETRNVTTEDRDRHSLLNAYRQLIAVHHDNATLRNGTQATLSSGSESVLVWVRRAPTGSRTVANVLGAINLSGQEATLSLDQALEDQGMRAGALRLLFASAPDTMTGETTTHLTLPPHGVLLGEIYHSGSLAEAAHQARHSSHHSGRRVRR